MKAVQLIDRRIPYSALAFAEVVFWQLPHPASGSTHTYKYRLVYVVNGACVLRYDNETGKGDHRHCGGLESIYVFKTYEKLMADFEMDIARWNRENSNP